jgi:DNA polymerase III delta prime subunit
MKDNYDEYQVEQIIELANSHNITTERVRELLNGLYDANFAEDISYLDEYLTEQAMYDIEQVVDGYDD